MLLEPSTTGVARPGLPGKPRARSRRSWQAPGVASIVWGPEVAEAYDAASASMFDPAVLDPTVDLLAALARGGPALELAIGTGRVALPLSARGVAVSGIELSSHMADQLRAKPGSEAVAVTNCEMTTTLGDGGIQLSILVSA